MARLHRTILPLCLLASACSSPAPEVSEHEHDANDEYHPDLIAHRVPHQRLYHWYADEAFGEPHEPGYRVIGYSSDHYPAEPLMLLAQTARAMSVELIASGHKLNLNAPIGVTRFVSLDDLTASEEFGAQLAESLSFELQQAGFSVIDFKLQDPIKVAPEGEWVYQRELDDLVRQTATEYVVVGSYSESVRGTMLNARMLDPKGKLILASSQQFLPGVHWSGRYADGVLLLGDTHNPIAEEMESASSVNMPPVKYFSK